MPAAFCEAHHPNPWSQGGETNLDDGRLLCPFHHQRAHDPGWNVNHHPNGTTIVHPTPIDGAGASHRPDSSTS